MDGHHKLIKNVHPASWQNPQTRIVASTLSSALPLRGWSGSRYHRVGFLLMSFARKTFRSACPVVAVGPFALLALRKQIEHAPTRRPTHSSRIIEARPVVTPHNHAIAHHGDDGVFLACRRLVGVKRISATRAHVIVLADQHERLMASLREIRRATHELESAIIALSRHVDGKAFGQTVDRDHGRFLFAHDFSPVGCGCHQVAAQ